MIIKVCGMREPNNIRAVEDINAYSSTLGKYKVDWMGFIFYHRSPRFVDSVPSYLPTRCRRVGVFVDANIYDILSRVRDYQLNYVQLHGSESPAFIIKLLHLLPASVRIMKMLPIATADDLQQTTAYEPFVDYFLFETKARQLGGHYGGSGKKFDWQLLQNYTGHKPFLLTGGIGPNDAELVKQFHHPQFAGIDLNSRFELQPALKDVKSISHFLTDLRF